MTTHLNEGYCRLENNAFLHDFPINVCRGKISNKNWPELAAASSWDSYLDHKQHHRTSEGEKSLEAILLRRLSKWTRRLRLIPPLGCFFIRISKLQPLPVPKYCMKEKTSSLNCWCCKEHNIPESGVEGISQMLDGRRCYWPSSARYMRLQLCQGYSLSYWLQKCKTKWFGEKTQNQTNTNKNYTCCTENLRLNAFKDRTWSKVLTFYASYWHWCWGL